MSTTRKNLSLISWYQAIQMSLLPIAIISLFWKHRLGLSMTEIMFLQAYFALCVGAFEFPSGYIADHLGYRITLIIGALTGSLGWAVYSVCTGFWQIMFASTILGISLSLVSGAPEAIIYETLKETGEEKEYATWYGRMLFWGQVSEGGFALLSGVLYSIAYRLPFYVQIFICLINVFIAIKLVEPKRVKAKKTKHFDQIKKLLKFSFIDHVGFRKIMIFSVLLSLASFIPVWIIQIHAKEIGYSYFVLGIFWSASNFIVALGAIMHKKIVETISAKWTLLACIGLILLGFSGLGLINHWIGPLFFLLISFVRGLQTPILGQVLQEYSSSEHRAALMSVKSMVFRFTFILIGPLIGWMIDKKGTYFSFLVVGSIGAILMIVCFIDIIKNVDHPYFNSGHNNEN